MSLTRRQFFYCVWCGTTIGGAGLAGCGCGPKARHVPVHVPPPPPKPAPHPSEASEGRLIAGHWAAVGITGVAIDEPLVPRGRWVSWSGWWVWEPDYLPAAVLASAMQEMWRSVPVTGPGYGVPLTYFVLLPGPFATTYLGRAILAWGQFNRGCWDGADVIHLGVTEQVSRHVFGGRYLPALEHELAHQRGAADSHAMEAVA